MVQSYLEPTDITTIKAAYRYAAQQHYGQNRASGEPYISHPLAVAGVLAHKRLDAASLVTALLHDTVEDTGATLEEVKAQFGEVVASLVDGVTKLSKLELQSDQSKQAENFRKLVISMSRDIRVLLVKLADRLHNMRTLTYIEKPDKRQWIAHETVEIYAPLAERIGMLDWRDNLTDLAFAELHLEVYQFVVRRLDYLREHGGDRVGRVIAELRRLLDSEGLHADVTGREKTPYSIWEKMKKKNLPFEQITDIMAFRILVNTQENCYQVLGIVHNAYSAVLGRFKDYISVPKGNGYKSLHTTVIGPENLRIEVQIRTHDMHAVAEYGVAAHWGYKENRGRIGMDDLHYSWVSGLIEILNHTANPEEFLEHTRMEMYQDRVFCFTPHGKLIELPQNATLVDFAYAVHSDIGDHCVGAKINGKLMPLRTVLRSGDQVEIFTAKNRSPSPEWERFVVTGKAKARIRRATQVQQREQYAALGKKIVRNLFTNHHAELNERTLAPALKKFGLASVDNLYAALGEGLHNDRELAALLFPVPSEQPLSDKVVCLAPTRRQKVQKRPSVPITGLIPGLAVHFARCCHPLLGDEIVGIVTVGKGVTIHTAECASLESFHGTPERWLDVGWDVEAAIGNVARLRVTVQHQPGKLAEISTTIAQNRGNITNLRFTDRGQDFFEMLIDIEVMDVSHLSHIIAALRAQPSIAAVDRARA